MASNPPKQNSRWGSLLSGAVAGLESRLDTILGEDDQASARVRAAEETSKQQKKALEDVQKAAVAATKAADAGTMEHICT